jgi:hypothetical protein
VTATWIADLHGSTRLRAATTLASVARAGSTTATPSRRTASWCTPSSTLRRRLARRRTLPAEQVEQLAAFEQRPEDDVIVAAREGMPTPVAVTAWGQRLLCGEVEPDAFDRFAEEHVGNGPEDVPRG